ncbi:MAG: biotin/lipoyl-binding protein, partial [Bacteroidota bacterium]
MRQLLVIPLLLLLASCAGGDGTSITETGTLEATEVTVSAQAGGPLLAVRTPEGSRVTAGDTLAVIDSADWHLQFQAAEANLAAAQAQLALSLEGPRKEDLRQAEASYESARNDLGRMEELAKSGSVTGKQLDDARTRYTLAHQGLEKLRRGSRAEEIALARARRDQAAAQAASLRKKVSDCTIVSPINGIVTRTFVEAGE